ncbi:MAG: DUF4114 domain-containing protein [Polyangiaceae bacterium]|nr:DUF4114 domain-containing protein [Polyangiaceae bacterium]
MRFSLPARLGPGLSALITCVAVGRPALALTQPDGTVIPLLNPASTSCAQPGNVQMCLNEEEGSATFDARAAAAVLPETYTPTCSLTFRVLARGAGFRNTFGWYNVVPGSKPADTDLHAFLECGDGPGTEKPLDIRSSPHYRGGGIGFFMATPEGASGNCPTFNPDGGPVAGTVGHVYYSQRAYNPDNVGATSYIHLITYNSIAHPASFYFAWEDLLSGGDNDFDDLLTRVSGIFCTGGGATCDTGFDGRCSFGTMQCRNGVVECVQNERSVSEACNGVDDDCNGLVDDGDLCEEGKVCYKGTCVPLCGGGEFRCPGAFVCDDGVCVDPDCFGVTCPEGEVCVNGECRGACDDVKCPHGQVCRAGTCVDPCKPVVCDSDYVCELGVCVLKCTCGQCVDTLVCDEVSERCVPDGCLGVTCQPGYHCTTGGICADDCQGASCPAGEACAQGACTEQELDAGSGGSGGVFVDGGAVDASADGSAGGAGVADGAAGSGGGLSGAPGGVALGDAGGCGCRVGGARGPHPVGWVLLAALLAACKRSRFRHS